MDMKKLGKWAFLILGGLLLLFVGLIVLSNLMAGRDLFNLVAVNDTLFRRFEITEI